MKVLGIALGLVLSSSVMAGAVTGAVAVRAPATAPSPLFTWVPVGGFADHFPFGQCTWWVAFNRRVTWSGDARDWLANAAAQGMPMSDAPSVGSIVVYRPGGRYSELGHVAVVLAVKPGSYEVSEMNAVGWGRISSREVPWPDPHVAGFIPLAPDERR